MALITISVPATIAPFTMVPAGGEPRARAAPTDTGHRSLTPDPPLRPSELRRLQSPRSQPPSRRTGLSSAGGGSQRSVASRPPKLAAAERRPCARRAAADATGGRRRLAAASRGASSRVVTSSHVRSRHTGRPGSGSRTEGRGISAGGVRGSRRCFEIFHGALADTRRICHDGSESRRRKGCPGWSLCFCQLKKERKRKRIRGRTIVDAAASHGAMSRVSAAGRR